MIQLLDFPSSLVRPSNKPAVWQRIMFKLKHVNISEIKKTEIRFMINLG